MCVWKEKVWKLEGRWRKGGWEWNREHRRVTKSIGSQKSLRFSTVLLLPAIYLTRQVFFIYLVSKLRFNPIQIRFPPFSLGTFDPLTILRMKTIYFPSFPSLFQFLIPWFGGL